MKTAERPFTFILDDPLANSYVQNLCTLTWRYDWTLEQDEELGLNDMKVAVRRVGLVIGVEISASA